VSETTRPLLAVIPEGKFGIFSWAYKKASKYISSQVKQLPFQQSQLPAMKSTTILATTVILQVAAAQSAYGVTNNSLTFETTIHIDASKRYQTMIGGGCSGAFGAACTTSTLSAADQRAVVETLFSENVGGLSVLRNLIGSSKGATILPQVPVNPASPANYTSITSINNDSCQLTLAQMALKYNPDLKLYADAWSAPGGFKTTGQEAGGGFICGVRRSNCTQDWREAYADYLIEYVRQYQQKGINTYLLGAFNE
jgi:glucosylceramidase